MARVKRAVHAKKHHRAVLELAQGYYGNKSRSYRAAHEQVMHSLQYAFRDRRARKGESVSYTHLDVYKRQSRGCPWARRQIRGPVC